jgi:hypothetical protein
MKYLSTLLIIQVNCSNYIDYEEKPMSVIKKLNVSNYYLQNDDNQINFTRLQHIDINSNEIYKKHIDLEEKLVSSKDYEKILISILNS